MKTGLTASKGDKFNMNIKKYSHLFDFEYKNLKFSYVLKFFQNTAAVSVEIHANCSQGEEFLINENNYEDAFTVGRDIFLQLRKEELEKSIVT
jgi:hypothetical protein